MTEPLRSFWLTVVLLWLTLGTASYVYSQQQHIPPPALIPVALALAIELPMYAAIGFPSVRKRIAAIPQPRLAAILTASAIAPYLLYAFTSATLAPRPLLLLAAIVTVPALWYLILPGNTLTDFLFLAIAGAAILSKIFGAIYLSTLPKLTASILGQLMWIRLSILVLILVRRVGDRNVSFIPAAREWRIGALYYVASLPILGLLAYAVQLGHLEAFPPGWLKLGRGALTFVGIFLVTALSEEFWFRSVLQPALMRLFDSRVAGLAVASILFGLVHLNFGNQFRTGNRLWSPLRWESSADSPMNAPGAFAPRC